MNNKHFSLIVCTDPSLGIGKNGSLPWKNSIDLLNFKRLSHNNVVIMGRKTWSSLPVRPLPDRVNIIISSTMKDTFSNLKDVLIFPNVEQMIKFRNGISKDDLYYVKDWFVIGGSSLYNYFLRRTHLLDSIYYTKMLSNYPCDTKLDIAPDSLFGWIEVVSERTRIINEKMRNVSVYYEMKKIDMNKK